MNVDMIQGITFKDVDAAENGGEFETKIVPASEMEFIKTKNGKGSWWNGDYKTDVNVTLKK